MKILFEETLWMELLSDIKEEPLERAYHLVGSRFRDKLIVYEIFEFRYVDRSPSFVVSDPMGRILLTNSLPAGLRILGIVHSHPFDNSENPKPSAIDIELAKEYYGEAIVTINNAGYATAVIYEDDGLIDINIEVRRLDTEKPEIVYLQNTYCVVPTLMTVFERKMYFPRFYAEDIYRLYLMSTYDKEGIRPPTYRWIWVRQVFEIPHKIFEGTMGEKQYVLLSTNRFTRAIREEVEEVT